METPVTRIAINGYGRIGRCVLRAIYERKLQHVLQVVAINEPADMESMAYLTRFDSTHGPFPATSISHDEQSLVIDGQTIAVTHAQNPEEVDWKSLHLDLVIECSGVYGKREQLQRFIDSGCPRVLVSHPADGAADVDYTAVLDINDDGLAAEHRIVSNASCTTNAIIPVLAELDKAFGIEHCFLTTLHSVMNDQPMIDGYHHKDLRRTRSAMQSIVPVATGLAQGVERLLPQLQGKVQAKAIRVPILNVSAIDLMVNLRTSTQPEAINQLFKDAATKSCTTIAFTNQPHASVDFNHDPHSVIVDGSQTRTNDEGFANLFVWFDNEWGFANRLVDIAQVWVRRLAEANALACTK